MKRGQNNKIITRRANLPACFETWWQVLRNNMSSKKNSKLISSVRPLLIVVEWVQTLTPRMNWKGSLFNSFASPPNRALLCAPRTSRVDPSNNSFVYSRCYFADEVLSACTSHICADISFPTDSMNASERRLPPSLGRTTAASGAWSAQVSAGRPRLAPPPVTVQWTRTSTTRNATASRCGFASNSTSASTSSHLMTRDRTGTSHSTPHTRTAMTHRPLTSREFLPTCRRRPLRRSMTQRLTSLRALPSPCFVIGGVANPTVTPRSLMTATIRRKHEVIRLPLVSCSDKPFRLIDGAAFRLTDGAARFSRACPLYNNHNVSSGARFSPIT